MLLERRLALQADFGPACYPHDWEGEPPGEPRLGRNIRLGGSLALPLCVFTYWQLANRTAE